jgi:diacylglycerol kinase (ATP)
VRENALIILNPAAGRGRARKLTRDIRHAFSGVGITDLHETQQAGEEEVVARQAIERGIRTIVAVGGDGTCALVANAILKSERECALAVLPCGTGNDFAKTLGVIDRKPEDLAALVAQGSPTPIDVGRIDDDYFINSCGFGFDASVLASSKSVRFLKGDAVYIYSALSQLFSYRGIEVSATGVPGLKRGPMLMVTVSNGRSLGGAFKIAPQASVFDGRLDACFFSDSNVVERVKLFLGAMRGTHIGMPSVSTASVQQLALTFPSSPLMEIDGELRVARSRTVELQCMPRALSVIAAPGALV